MQTDSMTAMGMTGDGCAGAISKALRAIDGVTDAQVSLANADATVQFDERLTSPETLRAAVQSAGYDTESQRVPGKRAARVDCGG